MEDKILLDKVVKQKHCETGKHLITEYNQVALQFREACVNACQQSDQMFALYERINALDGVVDKYLKGEKVGEEEANKLIHQFEQSCIFKVQAEKMRVLMLNTLNQVKKRREIFTQKLFKCYRLDKKKTYYFDFDKQAVYEVVEPAKNEAKPNQENSN